jgi:thiamine pyrophosphate-dependent acetolactate synthase large subunit-like protein
VPPSKYGPDLDEIKKAVSLLSSYKRPLIIVGKGCSYGRAEK